MSRRETMERTKEACRAGEHGGDQEPFGPTVESFAGEHPKQNDQACKNSDQADKRVNDCVDVQNHGRPITSVSTRNVTPVVLRSLLMHHLLNQALLPLL